MQFKVNLKKNYIIYSALEILSIIPKRRKFQIFVLFITMLISAISEIFLLGSIIPLITLISDPKQISKISFLKNYVNFQNPEDFLKILTPILSLFVVAVIFATVTKIFNIWLVEKLSSRIGADLSSQLFRRTLYKNYLSHLSQNTSQLISTLTIQISNTINAFKLFFRMLTSLIVGMVILCTLFALNKYVALSIFLSLAITYLLIAFLVRKKLNNNSKSILSTSRARIKVIQESLGGIRDIILSGSYPVFLNIYRKADLTFFDLRSQNSFLSVFPKNLLQGISLIFIALITAIFSIERNQEGSIIIIMGAFAIGLQRMVPQFQQFYTSWSTLKGFSSDVGAVLSGIKEPILISKETDKHPIQFQKITLENVYFRYSNNQDYVLKNINLEIKKGQRIGFIGSTGSGKSTIIDIIMGLLKPNKGKVLIDGKDIFDKENEKLLINWRYSISHVPQNIFLADCSIAENIAFGEHLDCIDMDKIEIASKKANIENFIKKLNQGFKSNVGERGVQLSGGQLQRIGIARALYRDTNILVFDEATSALDSKTEQNIINKINNLSDEKLLIMISHRYSTLKNCDYVFRIDNGVILQSGIPSKILKKIK